MEKLEKDLQQRKQKDLRKHQRMYSNKQYDRDQTTQRFQRTPRKGIRNYNHHTMKEKEKYITWNFSQEGAIPKDKEGERKGDTV
ncbi:Hypothetical predicted protein [Pelobates cultripes]|uniref:Uncharacterized protein n=1 Tax=Pelobates cultripes TaxID=61616 RepID=A0AAD1R315_PELCU|nr:Hypothetical predicted protein [Pelobates cultripes]